jgi:hypothetical protein
MGAKIYTMQRSDRRDPREPSNLEEKLMGFYLSAYVIARDTHNAAAQNYRQFMEQSQRHNRDRPAALAVLCGTQDMLQACSAYLIMLPVAALYWPLRADRAQKCYARIK